MYASLISAGASQLYDLYKSVTDRSSSTSTTSFKPQSPDASSSSTADSSSTSTGAVNSVGNSGSSFSSALQKLFVDLQASKSSASTASTSSTDPTSTVADGLQSAFKDAKASGVHGHRHAGHPPGQHPADDSQSATSSTSNPVQGLAASLLAYAKTQSLSASSSTSLTA